MIESEDLFSKKPQYFGINKLKKWPPYLSCTGVPFVMPSLSIGLLITFKMLSTAFKI